MKSINTELFANVQTVTTKVMIKCFCMHPFFSGVSTAAIYRSDVFPYKF